MEAGQSGKKITKAGIIIQARMDSVRLPGKVLKPLGNSNIFEIAIKRLKQADLPVILATSKVASNDTLVQSSKDLGIEFYRGSEDDVLSRYYEAAKIYKLDIIARVTGDNPLIDGELIKYYINYYQQLNNNGLYMATSTAKGFAVGMSFEIFSFSMLEMANSAAKSEKEREHVTPYFYLNKELFDVFYIPCEENKSNYRLTVDTPEDFELINVLVQKYKADKLSYKEILAIIDDHDELKTINQKVVQKKWFE